MATFVTLQQERLLWTERVTALAKGQAEWERPGASADWAETGPAHGKDGAQGTF